MIYLLVFALVLVLFVLVARAVLVNVYNRGRAAGFADGRRFPSPLPQASHMWPSCDEFEPSK